MPDTSSGVISVSADLDATESGEYAVNLVITSEGGVRRRSFPHSNCERLADAAALVIAMAILPASQAIPEPERNTEPEAPTKATAPVTVVPQKLPEPPPTSSLENRAAPTTATAPVAVVPQKLPELSPTSSLENRAAPRSTRSHWLGLGAAPHIGSGQLPKVAPGVGIWLELEASDWLYGILGLRYFPASEFGVNARANATVTVSLMSGITRACARSAGRTRLSLCGGAELGSMVGTGHGLDTNRTSTDSYLATSLGLTLDQRLSRRWSLVLGVEGGRTVLRPQLRIDGFGNVFHPNPWSCFGFAGLVIRPFA